MLDNCPFCNISDIEILISNEYAYARLDQYPVSDGHTLVIPYRHFSNYFDMTSDEKSAIWELVDEVKHQIRQEHSPDGYNIGINVGRAAGQTIAHMHVHVIPRFQGDMEDPQGGVRGVIPSKQKYIG